VTSSRRPRKEKGPPPCTWEAVDQQWLSPEHQADCADAYCKGCRPCGEDHCAMRGRCPNHVQHAAGVITCPECIGKVRGDLVAIENLHASMSVEAMFAAAGVESEAANMAGPAAAPEQFATRRDFMQARDHARGWCDFPKDEHLDADDPHHPFTVLASWEGRLREKYGPATDLFVTVSRARDYLTTLLAGPFPHGEEFEEFAADLVRCRSHLEGVAHDSRTPELGRSCPTCSTMEKAGPRLRKRYARHDRSGISDTWHCSNNPAHWWSEQDYRDRIASDYVEHSPFLAAPELADRLGVSVSTIRKWAARSFDEKSGQWSAPRLVSRRRGPDGRKVYRVDEARQLLRPPERQLAEQIGAS
jgi:hypothetical protein